MIRLQQVEHMVSEKSILSRMDHPFIVRLAGTFQDSKYLYMALEYIVGGEFFTHLRRAGRFDHPAARFYASQVTHGERDSHTHTHALTRTHIHTHMHTYTHTYIQAHTQAHTQAHSHAHLHTHRQTLSFIL